MDDVEKQLSDPNKNKTDSEATCCCGKIGLWKGIMILSGITMLFSILFMAFESTLGPPTTPWWVWGGTITGIVGGVLGCCGGLQKEWYKLTFSYLVWAICLTLWWFLFFIIEIIKISGKSDKHNTGELLWSMALFIWTGYTVYVINNYYRSIKPDGTKWNAFTEKKPGYNAIE